MYVYQRAILSGPAVVDVLAPDDRGIEEHRGIAGVGRKAEAMLEKGIDIKDEIPQS